MFRPILLVLVLACATAAGGAIYWSYASLPHPSDASPRQLGYWLVLRDLSKEPEDIRLSLIDRLIAEPPQMGSEQDSKIELTESQSSLLKKNIETLKFSWFRDRVGQYHRVDELDRWQFLNDQIQVVISWSELTAQYAELWDESTTADEQYIQFFNDVERWIGQVPDSEYLSTYQAVEAAIVCWLGTSSLADYPPVVCNELASRISREFEAGSAGTSQWSFVPEHCQELLFENSMRLVESWLLGRADAFGGLESDSEKAPFVDALIKDVERWGVVSLMTQLQSKEDDVSAADYFAALNTLSNEVQKWASDADDSQGDKLREMWGLINQRLLSSFFRRSQ